MYAWVTNMFQVLLLIYVF